MIPGQGGGMLQSRLPPWRCDMFFFLYKWKARKIQVIG